MRRAPIMGGGGLGGLQRSTSLIEKLTNVTYTSMEREEDSTLVKCLKPVRSMHDTTVVSSYQKPAVKKGKLTTVPQILREFGLGRTKFSLEGHENLSV